MTGMSRYYISRAFISVAFGGLFALTGSPWWMAILVSAVLIALFLYAPHSGRYAVHLELGVTAVLVIAGITVYFGAILSASVPVIALKLTLALAALTYFLSDFWLRRS
jgi:hypothetical protein